MANFWLASSIMPTSESAWSKLALATRSSVTGVDKDTVVRYALKAGQHARQSHDELVAFSPLHPGGPTG